jgi:hypothetical protein
MKTLLLSGLALLAVSTARAELFRSGVRDRGHGGHPSVRVSFGMPYRSGFGDYGYRGYAGYVGYYDYGLNYCSTLSNYGGYTGAGSYAADGLWLGALAGAIIGHNSGDLRHNGWRGAAWGAGIGWLLGSVADANRTPVTYAQPAIYAQPVGISVPAAVAPAPSFAGFIPPVAMAVTPMTAANGLFGR